MSSSHGLAAAFLAAPLLLPAPGAEGAEVRRARQLMGTRCVVTVTCDGEARAAEAAVAALDAIAAVEDRLSTWRPESELSRANAAAAGGRAALSPALAADLRRALDLARATGGAFDPTVGPLVEAWDLRGDGRIPAEAALAEARARTGWKRALLSEGGLSLPEGGWIDAGAFGKGLALDEAASALRDRGIARALLDFGGQLLALGSPPGERGWPVAIADPLDRARPALLLRLANASVATSSQAERHRLVDGRLIGHVLDPRTGRPVERRGSATVIAPSALEADALATALLVLGPAGVAELERPAAFLAPRAGGLTLHLNPGLDALLHDTAEGVGLEASP